MFHRIFIPALTGAIIFAVLSSIPGLSYVNGFFLFLLLIACIVSVHIFHKKHGEHTTREEACYIGSFTGLFGVIFTIILWVFLDYFSLQISPMMRLYNSQIFSDLGNLTTLVGVGVLLGLIFGLIYGLFANFLHRILHSIDLAKSLFAAIIVSISVLFVSLIINLLFKIAKTESVILLLNNLFTIIFFILMIIGGYFFIVLYDHLSTHYLKEYKQGIIFSVFISFFIVAISSFFIITDKIGWRFFSPEDFGAFFVALIVVSLLFSIPVLAGCLYGIIKFKPKHEIKKKIDQELEKKVLERKELEKKLKKKVLTKKAKKKAIKKVVKKKRSKK